MTGDAAIEWNIRPLDGIGPLKLGMTPDEVASHLDMIAPVSRFSPEDGGFLREIRTIYMPICQYLHGRLFLVDTHVNIPNVTLYGQDVYASDARELLQLLELKNGGAKTDYGFVVFDQLGINTEAFYSVKSGEFFEAGTRKQDDRGIALYQPGPETEIAGMSPISFVGR